MPGARREAPKQDCRNDAIVPHVPQAPGRHAWHTDRGDDSSGSSTRLPAAFESAGTDPSASNASSSSSHSTTGHRRWEGLEPLFDSGLAEEQPDGSVHFFL